MVEGIVVYSIRHLPDQAKNAMSIIAAADYEVGFREEMAPCETKQLKAAVESFMSRPEIRVIKKTKKSERGIRHSSCDLQDGCGRKWEDLYAGGSRQCNEPEA